METYLEFSPDESSEVEVPNIKQYLSILQKETPFNVGLVEDFLSLCHGKFEQMHYSNIA